MSAQVAPAPAARLALRCISASALTVFSLASAQACELLMRDHRSGIELARWAMNAAQPQIEVAFEHSVLGTTVTDTYRFTPQPVLVQEAFEGTGYGLPVAPAAGETLRHDGARSVLTLRRVVDPLVVRNLPAQRMRLLMGERELLLASLPSSSIELLAHHCPPAPP